MEPGEHVWHFHLTLEEMNELFHNSNGSILCQRNALEKQTSRNNDRKTKYPRKKRVKQFIICK